MSSDGYDVRILVVPNEIVPTVKITIHVKQASSVNKEVVVKSGTSKGAAKTSDKTQ